MVIRRDKETGKYYIAPSPPSFYEPKKPSSSGRGKTVPSNFIGPLQPGVTREPAIVKTVPSDFVGPLPRGTVRETPASKQPKMTAEQFQEMLRKQSQERMTEEQRRFQERITHRQSVKATPPSQQELSYWERTKGWWEEQKKIGEQQLTERDKKILKSREKYGGAMPFGLSTQEEYELGRQELGSRFETIPGKIMKAEGWWEEQKKISEQQLAERDKKILKSREKLAKYYRSAGYDVSTDFSIGAITGLTTADERAQVTTPVREMARKTVKFAEKTSIMPVFNKNSLTYDEETREWVKFKDKYPDRKFVSFGEMKRDVSKILSQLGEAEYSKRYNRAKKYTDNIYGDRLSILIYEQNKIGLDSGRITWDTAVKKSEKTKAHRDFVKKYTKTFTDALAGKTWKEVAYGTGESYLDLFPSTYAGMALTAYGVGKVAPAIGGRKVTGVIAHDPITQLSQGLYDIAPQPTSFAGQLVKGAGAAALMGPTIGTAYATELGKGLLTDPFKTTAGLVEWGIEAPGEFLGFGLGGGVRRQVKTQIGKVLSGKFVKPKEITLPSGEKVRVIDITTPNGTKVRVLLQEGKYAASEKVAVHQELKIVTEAKGQKFFIHASAKAIPTTKFKTGEYGIDVTIERGLYLAPESALTMPGTTQAFTHYMGTGGRTRQVGQLRYLWEKIVQGKDLEIAQGGRKAIQILQRKYPNLPKWMQESLLKKGSGLSKNSLIGINKWANRFDIANRNKKFNVPNIGEVPATEFIRLLTRDQKLSGNKLKSAKAIYQWNIETQKGVIGGPEFMTQTYGAEWQLIEPVGKKLEKVMTTREKLLRKIKIERGKEYTILGENMVDISWFMEQKPIKQKPIKIKDIRKKAMPSTPDVLSDFFRDKKVKIKKIEKVRVREPVVSFRAPSLMMDNLIGRPTKPRVRERQPIRPRPRDPFDNLIGRPTKPRVRERQPIRPRPRDPFDNLIGRPRAPVARERPAPIDILAPYVPRKKKPTTKTLKTKPIKKKKGYVAVITGFEAALGLSARYVEAGSKFTGFEAVRGRTRKKKKVVKQKPIKKKPVRRRKPTKKRDALSGWLY